MTETHTHRHRFEWEGRSIAWSSAGSGPPVVLLHGTPFSAQIWQPYAEELTSHHTVLTWDLPGYGQSSQHPGHPVDVGVHAGAFAALMGHWTLPQAPHVVAHDVGGGVALRAHLVEDVAFASLMLVDAVAVPPCGSSFFRFVADHPDVLDALPGYVHEAVVRAYIGGAATVALGPELLGQLVAPWLGPIGQPAFYRQISGFDASFLRENERLIGDVDVPTRVVWGAEDAWLPREVGRRLHGLIKGAEWREVPGAGHLVHHDAPVALAYEITAWLARQGRR